MPSLFDSSVFNERLFFPRKDTSAPPEGAVDLEAPVPGGSLHLRFYRNAAARATVLFFHGNGEVVSDYDESASLFAMAGASLSVMDYRGYGRSSGKLTLRNVLSDARPALSALPMSARPLVVMGRSLGASCAAELYQDPPPGVAGFIWESGFTDLHGLLRRRGMTPPAAFPPEDLAAFDPLPKLRRGKLPLLVLHGSEDELIPPPEAEAAFEAAGTNEKRLVYIPGRGHNDLSLSPLYWQTMAAFLAELHV
jgi:alpha-beta hydrolase superfamily lysophospholipase